MPQLSRFMRLSTAHVPAHLINQPGGLNAIEGVIADDTDYGTWLWVPDSVDEHLSEYDYAAAPRSRWHRIARWARTRRRPGARTIPEIEALWRHARRNGCDYIRLDADEPTDPALPLYEW